MAHGVKRVMGSLLIASMVMLSMAQGVQAQSPGQEGEAARKASEVATNIPADNLASVRELLEADQRAKAPTAAADPLKVDRAIAELTGDEVKDLTEKARNVKRDFAGGAISTATAILLVGVGIAAVFFVISVRDASDY